MASIENHHARKRFGQNFLVDDFWISKLANAIGASTDDDIVEIGPGKAALTRKLLSSVKHLRVVEIDRDLAAWLRSEFPSDILEVIEADALTVDWTKLASPTKKIRVVGNLPYNISSPLLFRLLEATESIADQHFMLQREVVDRMAAHPGSKTYGRLSVMLQLNYTITKLFEVPAGAFRPIPAVTSAFVRMKPKAANEIPAVDREAFSLVVAKAFSQRRKTLRNALSDVLTEDDIRASGIDPTARAETIAVDGFVRLANRYKELSFE